jgi:putative restriction endonuclease
MKEELTINNNINYWVFKTVLDENKSFQTIDSYEDSPSEYYNFDSLVPNYKQIAENDYVVLIDKKRIIGFSQISYVDKSNGIKILRRCPDCRSTTITVRKNKVPKYRCNRGHDFDSPVEASKNITKYKAVFKSYISFLGDNTDLLQLRPYYINNYNQNMSMQKLDPAAMELFGNIKAQLNLDKYKTLSPQESYVRDDSNSYNLEKKDEREIILQTIKLRRGQQNFRRELLKKFDFRCVITGCEVVDILEAAHIKPYRGKNDNHIQNGLILRADIHTLFDLNLIAINPYSYDIEVSNDIIESEYFIYNKKKLLQEIVESISIDALKFRWDLFKFK